jgi:Family of unknown function (DUF5677)
VDTANGEMEASEPPREPPEQAVSEQDARNAGARRELARAAGMAIYRTTSLLEGGSTFDDATSVLDVALLTFAARGRRLLHAAFRLIDAGEESEAAPLVRVLHEYLIVTRWLLLDPEPHTKHWALDDLRRRAVAAEETAKDEDLDEETRAAITKVAEDARAHYDRLKDEMGEDFERPPALEVMAKRSWSCVPILVRVSPSVAGRCACNSPGDRQDRRADEWRLEAP